MVGEWLTVDQVMDVVRRDYVYYKNSGGGVTFSGGEPMAQPRFLAACAKRCLEEGIHTALDTCGFVEWTVLERILPHIDLFLFDLKHMDSQKHERLTGVNNDLILENLRRIDQQAKPIWIRIPLIPGYNDSEENLGRIAKMVYHLTAVKKISILPYNSAAGVKYQLIGRDYSLEGLDYSKEKEQKILRIFATTKIEVEIGK
jgi:pyruvate formate lyase activating enzyme